MAKMMGKVAPVEATESNVAYEADLNGIPAMSSDKPYYIVDMVGTAEGLEDALQIMRYDNPNDFAKAYAERKPEIETHEHRPVDLGSARFLSTNDPNKIVEFLSQPYDDTPTAMEYNKGKFYNCTTAPLQTNMTAKQLASLEDNVQGFREIVEKVGIDSKYNTQALKDERRLMETYKATQQFLASKHDPLAVTDGEFGNIEKLAGINSKGSQYDGDADGDTLQYAMKADASGANRPSVDYPKAVLDNTQKSLASKFDFYAKKAESQLGDIGQPKNNGSDSPKFGGT